MTGISMLSMPSICFRGACACGIPMVMRLPAASYVKTRAFDCALADDDNIAIRIIKKCFIIVNFFVRFQTLVLFSIYVF